MTETRMRVGLAHKKWCLLRLGCFVALWASIPGGAFAQGTITGVTVEPAQAVTGQEVIVTIKGSENTFCADLQVGFGDGGTNLKNQAIGSGLQIKHVYAKAGEFTVIARGITGCSGTATAVVTVKSSPSSVRGKLDESTLGKQPSHLADLCTKVDCTGVLSKKKPKLALPALCPKPEIKAIPIGDFRPGGIIVVKGCGFGSTPGVISLGLSEPPFHTPWLDVIEWKDNFIGAQVPDESPLDSGVIDQPAKVWVLTKDKKKSNGWPANFKAHKTIIPLPPGAVKISCSDEAGVNSCSGDFKGATFHGYHNTAYDFDDSDEGWDEFSLTLKNGWIFDAMTFNQDFGTDDEKEGYAKYSSGFTYGSKSVNLKIKWRSDDTIWYWGTLHAVGPVGVPYK